MTFLEYGIQTPMAQGRSTRIISTIKWIRTNVSSVKKSLSNAGEDGRERVRATFSLAAFAARLDGVVRLTLAA